MAGVLLAASALAQPAIPLEKAILESRGELAPEQLKGLAWLPESDLYTELGDNTLKLYTPNGKLHAEVALSAVSPSGEDLERWPRISWESDEAFTYRRGNQLIRVKSMNGNRWGSTVVETIARLPQAHDDHWHARLADAIVKLGESGGSVRNADRRSGTG